MFLPVSLRPKRRSTGMKQSATRFRSLRKSGRGDEADHGGRGNYSLLATL